MIGCIGIAANRRRTRLAGAVAAVAGLLPLLIAAALVAPGGLSGPAASAAESLPEPVVAVIDYQRVMQDASAARSIREQFEARRGQFQEEIAAEEQRLHEADKELARQRSELTPEVFAERRRDFETEVAEVQRLVQQRRRQLDRASTEALDRVKQALIEVVTEMAEEHGFNLVLPASEVLFFSRRLDLTEEVMARLDEALPTVELPQIAAGE